MQALLIASLIASALAFLTLGFASRGTWGRIRDLLRSNAWQFAGVALGIQVALLIVYEYSKLESRKQSLDAMSRAAMTSSVMTQATILDCMRGIQEDIGRNREAMGEGVFCTEVREDLHISANQRIRGTSMLQLEVDPRDVALPFFQARFEYGRTRFARKDDGYSISTVAPRVFLSSQDGADYEIYDQADPRVDPTSGYFTLNRYELAAREQGAGFAVTTVTSYLSRGLFQEAPSTVQLTIEYTVEGWHKDRPTSFVYVNPREYGIQPLRLYEATVRFDAPLLNRDIVLLSPGDDGALRVMGESSDPNLTVQVSEDLHTLRILAQNGMAEPLAVFYQQTVPQALYGSADYAEFLASK